MLIFAYLRQEAIKLKDHFRGCPTFIQKRKGSKHTFSNYTNPVTTNRKTKDHSLETLDRIHTYQGSRHQSENEKLADRIFDEIQDQTLTCANEKTSM